ncbi:MAG TPA: hydrogenase maturation protease [Ktedonobacteraceae bacterium]|nr:hydrogenase maturation protease [Ktedonobacteraceae bacterium]
MSNIYRDFPGEDYAPPESVVIADKQVKAGDRVLLHPGKGRRGTLTDAMDMMLDGKTARIEVIQQDFENRIYLVVTLDIDPGREQWDERMLPGHRFFFFPEEVELLEESRGEESIEGTTNHKSTLEQAKKQKLPIRRILIACIGNIFLGDDSFGVEVAQKLTSRKTRRYPEGVHVIDFGIRGIDLAYTLLDDYDALILVDAVSRGGAPGTLYLIEPDLAGIDHEKGVLAGRAAMEAHSMDPLKVLAFARTLGAQSIPTFLIGCEPIPLDDSEEHIAMQMELSEPVRSALEEAVKMIDSLVDELSGSKM